MSNAPESIVAESEEFKLPRSSFDELKKIILAYARAAKPSSLEEISHLCGINKTVISANNSFLASIGVIEGGKAKAITTKGERLARAIDHQQIEDEARTWREIAFQHSFLHKMITAIRIRQGFEQEGLESHIAYSAGEPKSAQVMTGARTVIDLLKAAQAITDEAGTLTAVTSLTSAPAAPSQPSGTSEAAPFPLAPMPPSSPTATATVTGRHVTITINLNITATADQIDDVGSKLSSLIEKLTNGQSK